MQNTLLHIGEIMLRRIMRWLNESSKPRITPFDRYILSQNPQSLAELDLYCKTNNTLDRGFV